MASDFPGKINENQLLIVTVGVFHRLSRHYPRSKRRYQLTAS
jgi:hypothetical protein